MGETVDAIISTYCIPQGFPQSQNNLLKLQERDGSSESLIVWTCHVRILKIERFSPTPLYPWLRHTYTSSIQISPTQACNLYFVFCFAFKFSRFVPGLDYHLRVDMSRLRLNTPQYRSVFDLDK